MLWWDQSSSESTSVHQFSSWAWHAHFKSNNFLKRYVQDGIILFTRTWHMDSSIILLVEPQLHFIKFCAILFHPIQKSLKPLSFGVVFCQNIVLGNLLQAQCLQVLKFLDQSFLSTNFFFFGYCIKCLVNCINSILHWSFNMRHLKKSESFTKIGFCELRICGYSRFSIFYGFAKLF